MSAILCENVGQLGGRCIKIVSTREACAALHTPQPSSYSDWHEWAEAMAETHDQSTCPHCGKWEIWTERTSANPRARWGPGRAVKGAGR